jgi:hypothetical protein
VFVLIGDGRGGFAEAPGAPEHAGIDPRSVRAVDLNDDGRDDLVVLDTPDPGHADVRALMNTSSLARPRARIPLQNVALSYHEAFAGQLFGTPRRLSAYFLCEPGAMDGRKVALYERHATVHGRTRWREIAVAVSDARGGVAQAVRPSVNAWYQWRPADHRRPRLTAAPAVSIPVIPAIDTTITGRRIDGKVRPGRPGTAIELQQNLADDPYEDDEIWSTIARTRLDRSSSFVFKARHAGIYRVYRRADALNIAGESTELDVP